jgi:hypothetical protein
MKVTRYFRVQLADNLGIQRAGMEHHAHAVGGGKPQRYRETKRMEERSTPISLSSLAKIPASSGVCWPARYGASALRLWVRPAAAEMMVAGSLVALPRTTAPSAARTAEKTAASS